MTSCGKPSTRLGPVAESNTALNVSELWAIVDAESLICWGLNAPLVFTTRAAAVNGLLQGWAIDAEGSSVKKIYDVQKEP
jgi:hypothetical protein